MSNIQHLRRHRRLHSHRWFAVVRWLLGLGAVCAIVGESVVYHEMYHSGLDYAIQQRVEFLQDNSN